ncbi:hypothetical protein L345_12652, partial [Ophiophagus hannah]
MGAPGLSHLTKPQDCLPVLQEGRKERRRGEGREGGKEKGD